MNSAVFDEWLDELNSELLTQAGFSINDIVDPGFYDAFCEGIEINDYVEELKLDPPPFPTGR